MVYLLSHITFCCIIVSIGVMGLLWPGRSIYVEGMCGLHYRFWEVNCGDLLFKEFNGNHGDVVALLDDEAPQFLEKLQDAVVYRGMKTLS